MEKRSWQEVSDVMSAKSFQFSPIVLQKFLALQLALKLNELLSRLYPRLLRHCQAIIDRLQPVRGSQHGRKLRAWGRDYHFTAEQAPFVRRLVKQYELGLSVELPEGSFAKHPAIADGVLCEDAGVFWLQEPAEEADKPVLVLFTGDSDPYAGLEKEALALAWLTMHPEWTDTQIAAKCGINRTTLYDYVRYKAARAMLKQGREQFREWQQT
jgi:hypothetical protein